jgi:hypothetical protein
VHLGLSTAGARPSRPENRFGLDYLDAARELGPPPTPIVDIHTHANGAGAGPIFARAARAFGVRAVFTMVRVQDAPLVRSALGDLVHFIAFPNFRAPDRRAAFSDQFLVDIQEFHDRFNARWIKLWNAPRMHDFFPGDAGSELIEFDSPWRIRHIELAQSLGMGVMVHTADPDTWFATRYADAAKYRAKREHYRGLEAVLDRFEGPWIAAHMGGSPEDLDFLDGLLARHPNLHLDTSATKWVVRELSKHPRPRVRDFFERWRGRILFGSDIVATDDHLAPTVVPEGQVKHPMADLADSPGAALDLYCSRYFALRQMFETEYDGASPIADPDLAMIDPRLTDPMAAPPLRGLGLSRDVLEDLYANAARALLERVGVEV